MYWYTEADDNENTTYFASSAWHDDGVHFTYRLVPMMRQNKVFWVEAHDAELQSGKPKTFRTIRAGKTYVEKIEIQIKPALTKRGFYRWQPL